jgi:protein-disulfide isomerase
MKLAARRWSPCFVALTIASLAVQPARAQSLGLDSLSNGISEVTDADDVVASVAGRTIGRRELARRWQSTDAAGFARLQSQIRDAYSKALDDVIGEYLLQAEADRQRMTVEELLSRADERIETPTAEEIRGVFERSSAAVQGVAFDVASPLISQYLKQQKSAGARQRYVDELRRSDPPSIKIPIDSWRQTIAPDMDAPQTGSAAAAIEIVEFSDFQCPFCRRTAPLLKEVLARYADHVRLVWRDFPLPMHEDARRAAVAAQCANEQGRFWLYHDLLFAHQDALKDADLIKHALTAELNLDRFKSCVGAGQQQVRIDAAIKEGNRLGISATPTVFINGRMVVGTVPMETYDRIIQEELTHVGRTTP